MEAFFIQLKLWLYYGAAINLYFTLPSFKSLIYLFSNHMYIKWREKMKNNLSMGEIILSLRKKKGLTQEGLANAIGISAQAVSKWENGGMPDIELVPVIADFFDVSIDVLFGRKAGPNIAEAVHEYIYECGPFQGFDKAFNIYNSIHYGLAKPKLHRKDKSKDYVLASHNSSKNGYSLMMSNGYGNIVKREFWESINMETVLFSRDLFSLLGEPGIINVLFAILCRKEDEPANFDIIKAALVNTDCSDEVIKDCLDKLIERGIITVEYFSKIVKVDDLPDKVYRIDIFWYLGLCSLFCAAQVLNISRSGIQCSLEEGAWPINL